MGKPAQACLVFSACAAIAASILSGCGRRSDPIAPNALHATKADDAPGEDTEATREHKARNKPFVLDPLL